MGQRYKKMVIIDVECTCWEDKGQHISEIIEIGAALVDLEKMKVIKNEGIIVKPVESFVSEFCTKLTTLTQADVDRGVSFQEACAKLVSEYGTRGIVWGSWGAYDHGMFVKECQRKHVDYPFNKVHLNIKAIHAILNGLPEGVGMDSALLREKLPMIGTHHRGVDDANNIAEILLSMVNRSKNVV